MSSVAPLDLAYRVLRLEQQLDAYQRLHTEELEQFRQALNLLKDQVLALVAQQEKPGEAGGEATLESTAAQPAAAQDAATAAR